MSDQYGPSGWQPQNPGPAQGPGQPQQGWQPQEGWQQPGWQQPNPQGAGASGQEVSGQPQPAGPPHGPQNPPTWQQGPAFDASAQPPGGQYPGAQYPGGQNPGAQYPGSPYSETQYAGAPGGGGKPKSRTPLILTVVAVVVALLAGGGIWWLAARDTATTTGGEASPQAAASSMLLSLSSKDIVGVAAQLDPAEAALFTDLSGDIFAEMKRLGIIKPDADPQKLTGTVITTKDLTFDDKAEEKVNDHVTIVKLTGGTITVALNPGELPLTDKVKGAFPELEKQVPSVNETVNIADQVAKNGGEPFRIATVKRGDNWYPSLFYTVADNAYQQLRKDNPQAPANPSDLGSITAIGAGSPEDAVNTLIDKALAGDIEGVIGMLPPDEMGVLYDYARAIIVATKMDKPEPVKGVTISDRQWQVDDVSGGKKVSIKSLTVAADKQTVSIVRDVAANTVTVTVSGQEKPIVLSPDTIEQFVAQMSRNTKLDPRLVDIIKREFVQVIGIGVTTVQVDGKWYVSPLRSYTNVLVLLLKGLQPGDIDFFLEMAHK